MKTTVVHFKKEPYDVYIGRPSKWGNPFSHKPGTLAEFRVRDRKEAIQKFEEYLLNNEELMNDLHELKGKVLGCWWHLRRLMNSSRSIDCVRLMSLCSIEVLRFCSEDWTESVYVACAVHAAAVVDF
jgi:hypothetical protein